MANAFVCDPAPRIRTAARRRASAGSGSIERRHSRHPQVARSRVPDRPRVRSSSRSGTVRRPGERVQVVDEEDRIGPALASASTASRRSSAVPCQAPPARSRAGQSSCTGVSRRGGGIAGSPRATARANARAHAVLPTPGSPTTTAELCRRRSRIAAIACISSSKPTTGSISPCRALATRSSSAVSEPLRQRAVPRSAPSWPACACGAARAAGPIPSRPGRLPRRPAHWSRRRRIASIHRIGATIVSWYSSRASEVAARSRASRASPNAGRAPARPRGWLWSASRRALSMGSASTPARARTPRRPALAGRSREQGEEDDLHPDRGESDSGRLFSRLAEHPLPVWILPLAELSHGEEIHPCSLPRWLADARRSLRPVRTTAPGRARGRPFQAGAAVCLPARLRMRQGGHDGRRRAGIGIDSTSAVDRLVQTRARSARCGAARSGLVRTRSRPT